MGCPPQVARAGVPFVIDDPDTPDARHWEINVAAQGTRNRDGWTGNMPMVEANYGVTEHLQFTLLTPLAFNRAVGASSSFGLGDMQAGFKYRVVDADDWGWRPAVAVAPSITAPTGNASLGLGGGKAQAFLPVWLSKEFNQWTVFGGGGYTINPGVDRKNWWLGGVGVTREINPTWTVGAEIFYSTPTQYGQFSSVGFNVGVIYNISDTHHILVSVGRNITHANDNNAFSSFIGYQLTF